MIAFNDTINKIAVINNCNLTMVAISRKLLCARFVCDSRYVSGNILL